MTKIKNRIKNDEVIPMKYDGMFCEIFNNKKNIRNRNVIFLADIHSSQNYENYNEILETVQINLLAFNYRNKFKSSLYLCDLEDGYIITKKLRLDMINMVIGKDMCYTGNTETDKMIKWSKAFMSKSYKELNAVLEETLTKKSKNLLLSEIVRLSGDEKMVKEYREKTKQELEYESFLYEHNEMIKEVEMIKEQLNNEKEKLDNILKNKEYEKSIEIAKNLLSMNMSVDDITKATGLTKEEIENL